MPVPPPRRRFAVPGKPPSLAPSFGAPARTPELSSGAPAVTARPGRCPIRCPPCPAAPRPPAPKNAEPRSGGGVPVHSSGWIRTIDLTIMSRAPPCKGGSAWAHAVEKSLQTTASAPRRVAGCHRVFSHWWTRGGPRAMRVNVPPVDRACPGAELVGDVYDRARSAAGSWQRFHGAPARYTPETDEPREDRRRGVRSCIR
jgi:hypothetical protein